MGDMPSYIAAQMASSGRSQRAYDSARLLKAKREADAKEGVGNRSSRLTFA
jgi:hypothetical protein